MSYVDNDPPKHNNVDVFHNPKKYDLHGKGLNLEGTNRIVVFTMEEIRVLVLHGEAPIMCHGNRMSRKGYKLALEQKQRAKQYIAEEKAKKETQEEME